MGALAGKVALITGGGSGLGLAIVRSAVESCGGSVRAETGAPGGLVLVFLLRGGVLLGI